MREMKITEFVETLKKEVDDIMEDFKDYTEGVRVLLLLKRQKEGGPGKEHRRRRARFVSHNREQFKDALFELLLLKESLPAMEYRIYSTSSPRDVRKAEMEFKRVMLDVDFAGKDNKQFFYEHIEDKWISALMSSNPVKGEGLFVLDIDSPDNGPALKKASELNLDIKKIYKTKNGWHIVTAPFNKKLFPAEIGEVKDDGLLLLNY